MPRPGKSVTLALRAENSLRCKWIAALLSSAEPTVPFEKSATSANVVSLGFVYSLGQRKVSIRRWALISELHAEYTIFLTHRRKRHTLFPNTRGSSMFRTVRLALLATCLVVAGGAAQAATYLFSFDSTFTNGSAAAGISGNDAFSLQVLVDNGGNTDLNQQWFQADVLSATLTSGSYTATFNAPYLNDLTFVTDGAGQITQSNWYDVDSNNTDTLGPGSPKAFANLLRLSNGEGLSYARLISDTQGWTVSAVSQIPLPAGGLLLLGGLGALAALRRRKV